MSAFRDAWREPHAEAVQTRREQTVQLLEDPVFAARIAFHQ